MEEFTLIRTTGRLGAVEKLVKLSREVDLTALRKQEEADRKALEKASHALTQATAKQAGDLSNLITELTQAEIDLLLGEGYLLVQTEGEYPIRKIIHTKTSRFVAYFSSLELTQRPPEQFCAFKAYLGESARYARSGRWRDESGFFWNEVAS
jgi:hypothetical protein